jgi:hypothetical protein
LDRTFSKEENTLAKTVGEVTGPAGQKMAMFVEALQLALENSPPPPPGTDVQNFRMVAVELEHGGIVGSTKTRVILDVQNGPLK